MIPEVLSNQVQYVYSSIILKYNFEVLNLLTGALVLALALTSISVSFTPLQFKEKYCTSIYPQSTQSHPPALILHPWFRLAGKFDYHSAHRQASTSSGLKRQELKRTVSYRGWEEK